MMSSTNESNLHLVIHFSFDHLQNLSFYIYRYSYLKYNVSISIVRKTNDVID
jgi:hypothetical protein